jgi:hypothetical protein
VAAVAPEPQTEEQPPPALPPAAHVQSRAAPTEPPPPEAENPPAPPEQPTELPIDPLPERAAAPEPEPVPPPAPVPAGLEEAASALASGDPGRAYALASTAYDDEPSANALRLMVLASCKEARGGQARLAYRKLKGGAPRTEARAACQEHGVNLSVDAREDTSSELVTQGQMALARGDAARAHELGRQSQRLERSTAAVLLMGRAGCKLADPEKAKFAWAMLRPNLKESLASECEESGIVLSGGA